MKLLVAFCLAITATNAAPHLLGHSLGRLLAQPPPVFPFVTVSKTVKLPSLLGGLHGSSASTPVVSSPVVSSPLVSSPVVSSPVVSSPVVSGPVGGLGSTVSGLGGSSVVSEVLGTVVDTATNVLSGLPSLPGAVSEVVSEVVPDGVLDTVPVDPVPERRLLQRVYVERPVERVRTIVRPVQRIVERPVAVPVRVERPIPVRIERPVHVPVRVERPIHVPVRVEHPVLIPEPLPAFVREPPTLVQEAPGHLLPVYPPARFEPELPC